MYSRFFLGFSTSLPAFVSYFYFVFFSNFRLRIAQYKFVLSLFVQRSRWTHETGLFQTDWLPCFFFYVPQFQGCFSFRSWTLTFLQFSQYVHFNSNVLLWTQTVAFSLLVWVVAIQPWHLRRIPLNVRAISAKIIYQKTTHSTVTF